MTMPDMMQLPIEYRRVGFGKRLLAALIDLAIAMVGGALVGLFLTATGILDLSMIDVAQLAEMQDDFAAAGLERDVATEVVMFASGFGVGFVGFVLVLSVLEAVLGASVGKMTLQLEIGTMDGRKGNVKLWIQRWIIKNLGTLIPLLGTLTALSALNIIGQVVGFVLFVGCFLAAGSERLALHDRIAQTAIFHKDDLQ